MELFGDVKNYDWGKLGTNSEVARLLIANNDERGKNINENVPYAELWMGNHESGPATIKCTGEKLSVRLRKPLSYLFKVLSIRKALSIQVHPNKQEAVRLHSERPDIYKDPNHKPELAIALTPFTALCGFRPYTEIHAFCTKLSPLKELINDDANLKGLCEGSVEGLKTIYKTLMISDEQLVRQAIENINKNYMEMLCTYNLHELFATINRDFPGDVGVLSIFFLNVLHLQPGDAIYLGAKEIHAYLQGDCVECMACSDNVIRAGLTPKYKDVEQLLNCLNYEGQPAELKYFKPKQLDNYVKIFSPPVEDFAVVCIHIPKNESGDYDMALPPNDSILLVIQGSRLLRSAENDMELKRGSIIYLPAELMPKLRFLNKSDCLLEDFRAYLATVNYML